MDIHEDDEDPATIRAAFDRGPHGLTGMGGVRLACDNGFATGGYIDPHKDCRAALDAAQDEIEKCIEEREDQRLLIRQLGSALEHVAPAAARLILGGAS